MTQDKRETGIKKVCCFFAGEGHFLTMVLPYLIRRIKKGARVIIFLGNDMGDKIPGFLNSLDMDFGYKDWQESVVQYPLSTAGRICGEELLARHFRSMVELLGLNCSGEGLIVCVQKPDFDVDEISWKLEVLTPDINAQVELINCYEFTIDREQALKIMAGHEFLLSSIGISRINEVHPDIKMNAMV